MVLDRITRLWPVAPILVACLAAGSAPAAAKTEKFKVKNIHIETNSSGCDMGIQIGFDTDGIVEGDVRNPKDRIIYDFETRGSMRKTGGQTEGFLEGIEPQITELLDALGCEPSDEEGTSSLQDLFDAFPDGNYTFEGKSADGTKLESRAKLSHRIPAGPKIDTPAPGTGNVDPDGSILIDWEPVSTPILPQLGPVTIVGYHVVVQDAAEEVGPELDVDLPASETSLTVPAEYLQPNTVYQFEVLSTEKSGNQTITEGLFCTAPIASSDCELP